MDVNLYHTLSTTAVYDVSKSSKNNVVICKYLMRYLFAERSIIDTK